MGRQKASIQVSIITVSEQGTICGANGREERATFKEPDDRIQELILIAEGMTAIASLVFGEGEFDRTSIYGTSTARGGGKIWRIPVGVKGAMVNR